VLVVDRVGVTGAVRGGRLGRSGVPGSGSSSTVMGARTLGPAPQARFSARRWPGWSGAGGSIRSYAAMPLTMLRPADGAAVPHGVLLVVWGAG